MTQRTRRAGPGSVADPPDDAPPKLHGNMACYRCQETFHASTAASDGDYLTCPTCGHRAVDTRFSRARRIRCENCGSALRGGQLRWCGPICFGAGNKAYQYAYPLLAEQQGNLCGICLLPLPVFRGGRAAGHVDHIVSRHSGGTDHPANLAAAHTNCNLSKGDSSLAAARTHLGMTETERLNRLCELPESLHGKLRGEPLCPAPSGPKRD